MGGGPWTEARQIQDGEVLALLKRQTAPKFAAGTSWRTATPAMSYRSDRAKVSSVRSAFLRQRIFQPCHMNHRSFSQGQQQRANRAFGHAKQAQGFEETRGHLGERRETACYYQSGGPCRSGTMR